MGALLPKPDVRGNPPGHPQEVPLRLRLIYLKREHLRHRGSGNGNGHHEPGSMDLLQGIARLQEDAPPCSECGMIMVRAGACYRCLLDYQNQPIHGLLDRQLGRAVLAYVLEGTEPALSHARSDELAAYLRDTP